MLDNTGMDAKYHTLIREAELRALSYVSSFEWRPDVKSILYSGGVPGIVSVFLVQFRKCVAGFLDDRLWVIVGDLPSAYLVLEAGETAYEVLVEYCRLMEDWVGAVRGDGDLAEVFPVRAEPTERMAAMLEKRLSLLRSDVMANMPDAE